MRMPVALFLFAVPGVALASAIPTFHLCSAYVQKAVLSEQTDLGWPVFVQLTSEGSRSLEAFTQAHRGRMVRVAARERELLRSTIWLPVSSGNLHRAFRSREAALTWQRRLSTQLPSASCGAGNRMPNE